MTTTFEERERFEGIALRIRKIALSDPVVYALLRYYVAGELGDYENFLEQVFFHTHALKEKMLETALTMEAQRPIALSA